MFQRRDGAGVKFPIPSVSQHNPSLSLNPLGMSISGSGSGSVDWTLIVLQDVVSWLFIAC